MREKIVQGNIYHILNRGVDKRNLFLEEQDYFRFIHNLFEFNDENFTSNSGYRFKNTPSIDIARRYNERQRQPRKLLVEILAFCLMPNHYHFLIKPLSDDAITKFIKKVNMGYARYFNEKYQRKGTLFEGRYKLVSITNDDHFLHIPYYIHLNPLDLSMPEWREKKIINPKKAMTYLESYRWSSHLDYIGIKNFPSITSREFLLEFFGGPKKYKESISDWIKNLEINEIEKLLID